MSLLVIKVLIAMLLGGVIGAGLGWRGVVGLIIGIGWGAITALWQEDS